MKLLVETFQALRVHLEFNAYNSGRRSMLSPQRNPHTSWLLEIYLCYKMSDCLSHEYLIVEYRFTLMFVAAVVDRVKYKF